MVCRDAMVPEHPHPVGQRPVVGRHHSSFAGGDVFDRVKRETREPRKTADRAAPEARAKSMTGVRNDLDPARLGDSIQRIVVSRLAAVVDRHDRARPCRDPLRDAARIDQQRVSSDVREHRGTAFIQHAIRAGRERQGRNNDLIAGLDAQGAHRGVESRCAIASRHAFPRAYAGGACTFELGDPRPGRQPIGAEHLRNSGNVVISDLLMAVRQHLHAHRRAAMKGQCVSNFHGIIDGEDKATALSLTSSSAMRPRLVGGSA